MSSALTSIGTEVAILTGGGDRHYALGLADSLIADGIRFDFIGSDFLESAALRKCPQVRVLNLRGATSSEASLPQKLVRVGKYYARLIRYAASAEPRVFHILWNNKLELFDRTALMVYYRALGKRIVLTAHNVNIGRRDNNDSLLNRVSLRIQYRLADHIFVHTEKMKAELTRDFGVASDRISVIPYGINNTLPTTTLTVTDAKQQLGVGPQHRTVLFFGYIAPYKGLEYMVSALAELGRERNDYRLIIAGDLKGSEEYWQRIRAEIDRLGLSGMLVERIAFIPDEEVECYFKAADVLVLPYIHIFQSGVLSLGYSFGLPVVASDIASIAEDVMEGTTGFTCRPRDPLDLARTLRTYFDSPLYRDLAERRRTIQAFANDRYSWEKVGHVTGRVYRRLLGELQRPGQ